MNAIRIVGAGPTGAMLALLLGKRGNIDVELYESRGDLRSAAAESGRSINLALADRGIHALRVAGVLDDILPLMLPMRGRLIHQEDGTTAFQPYGQRPAEVIYSVSRHHLNQALLSVAGCQPNIRLFFGHRFERADFAAGTAQIRDLERNRLLSVSMRPLLAADGAASSVRRQMSAEHLIHAAETDLEHGYKELSIPAAPDGGFRLRADALHIWPRGIYMLIALPNGNGSFTATLFLPKDGPMSFQVLAGAGAEAAQRFLARSFPDAFALMPDCTAQFMTHPMGFLGTVAASPWHMRGQAALLGDSAHAMVPFHGQGMNCCFEDCIEFDACVARHGLLAADAQQASAARHKAGQEDAGQRGAWETVFAEFGAARKPNTDAIAAMALENYREMRELVADPKFQLRQALSLELERRFPQRFIPRYSMVMFHHEIPYAVARERGAVQAQILSQLIGGAARLGDVDFALAKQLIEARLNEICA